MVVEILSMTDPTDRISLVTPLSRSLVMAVQPTNQTISIHIVPTSWGAAGVRAVWSVNGEDFTAFTPDIQFSSSTPGRERLSLAGIAWFALEIVTPDGAADSNAAIWAMMR